MAQKKNKSNTKQSKSILQLNNQIGSKNQSFSSFQFEGKNWYVFFFVSSQNRKTMNSESKSSIYRDSMNDNPNNKNKTISNKIKNVKEITKQHKK